MYKVKRTFHQTLVLALPVEEDVKKPEAGEMISVAPSVKGNEPWLAPVLCLSNDPEFTKGITVSYNGIMKQSGTCRNVL